MTKPEDARADILDAAFAVLQEGGVPSVTYTAIAEKGGISRQLVRYYFKDPDDLMVALCDQLADAYRDGLLRMVAEREDSRRLDGLLDYMFGMLDDHRKPEDDQVYDAMFAMAARSGAIRNNLRGQYTLLGQVVSHEINQQYPELSQQDCDELSFLFVNIMYGHWKMVSTLGFSREHSDISRLAIDRIIASYRVKGAMGNPGPRVWKARN